MPSAGTGTFATNLEANTGSRTSVYSSATTALIAGTGAEAFMARVSPAVVFTGSLGRD
jgi:hypothetical protein